MYEEAPDKKTINPFVTPNSADKQIIENRFAKERVQDGLEKTAQEGFGGAASLLDNFAKQIRKLNTEGNRSFQFQLSMYGLRIIAGDRILLKEGIINHTNY